MLGVNELTEVSIEIDEKTLRLLVLKHVANLVSGIVHEKDIMFWVHERPNAACTFTANVTVWHE